MKPKFRIFAADFETTVYKGQTFTEVWSAACVEVGTDSEEVLVVGSIQEFYHYFVDLKENCMLYFHNLKFDGSFWLSYFITELHMAQAFDQLSEAEYNVAKIDVKEMPKNSFNYLISDMGQWYEIVVKTEHNKTIRIRDSLKLLPFSLKAIGKSFGTKHQKLDMEYTGLRYAGCKITDEELAYIKNDVLVLKEALEFIFGEGHKKLTIGSCCLAEYKKLIGKDMYKTWFPDIYQMELNEEQYGSKNAGEYIRKSYKGGWCYLVKGKENKIKKNGTTADVNSLYPSMMSSESGNRFPIGMPTFWKGDIPEYVDTPWNYYFVRIRTRFYIKKGMLPFIQIKNTFKYRGNEALETSDILNRETGEYKSFYIDFDGKLKPATVELTLTCTDYKLFREHYDVKDFEILDGCWFKSEIGIFDDYIEKYKKIKLESKGAKRTLAKLFLNNLYGKMASSQDSSFKYAYEKEDGTIGFVTIQEYEKEAGYIPVGSAITSYARNFTIRAAQKNYYGKNKRGFIYADTDSIHCDLPPEEIKGITVHEKNFCCWKLESCWDKAIFTRQKTYIEHVTHEDLEPIENPYYTVRCAGMPDRCKELFLKSMQGFTQEEFAKMTEEEQAFVKQKRKLEDFKVGLIVPSALKQRRIKGGVLLIESNYVMR